MLFFGGNGACGSTLDVSVMRLETDEVAGEFDNKGIFVPDDKFFSVMGVPSEREKEAVSAR